jgi:hypothetical protein
MPIFLCARKSTRFWEWFSLSSEIFRLSMPVFRRVNIIALSQLPWTQWVVLHIETIIYGRIPMTSLFRMFPSIVISLVTVLMMNGCATILHGSEEGVYFTSEPDKAKVYVNGEMKGTTPVQLMLVSKETYIIDFKKDGYKSQSMTLENGVGGGWVVFDILFGVVPLIFDAATGCWYTFDTVHLRAELEQLLQGQTESPSAKEAVEQPTTPSKEYTHIGTGHWVTKVMDNGNMIVLEDGSIWDVAPGDAAISAKWPNATPISIGVGKGDYLYQLIDIGANKAVQAKYVGQK